MGAELGYAPPVVPCFPPAPHDHITSCGRKTKEKVTKKKFSSMLPMQSIEAETPSSITEDNGESRQQKPKTLPCKYCSKRFR